MGKKKALVSNSFLLLLVRHLLLVAWHLFLVAKGVSLLRTGFVDSALGFPAATFPAFAGLGGKLPLQN